MNGLMQVGWTWYPSVLIGFGLWTAAYVLLVNVLRPKNHWGPAPAWTLQLCFHIGTLVGLLALVSPLDELGDEYLFSAHMIQHLLLMFVVAPLWLVGTPAWLMDLLFPLPFRKLVENFTRPLAAYAIFIGVLILWHVPALYNLALQSEGVHIFEHVTFIGAALVGWWPVAAATSKVALPVRMLYLFLIGIPNTALAAILTFSSQVLYPFYANAPRLFGLSVLDDQHLGGLLMWIPMHMVLFLAFGTTFIKWFNKEDQPSDNIYEIGVENYGRTS